MVKARAGDRARASFEYVFNGPALLYWLVGYSAVTRNVEAVDV